MGYWLDKKERSFIHRHIFVTITLKEVCAYLTNGIEGIFPILNVVITYLTTGIEGIFPILNVVITFLLTCPDE